MIKHQRRQKRTTELSANAALVQVQREEEALAQDPHRHLNASHQTTLTLFSRPSTNKNTLSPELYEWPFEACDKSIEPTL